MKILITVALILALAFAGIGSLIGAEYSPRVEYIIQRIPTVEYIETTVTVVEYEKIEVPVIVERIKVIEVPEYILVEVPEYIEVTKYIEVPVITEILIEVPVSTARYFNSEEELYMWVAAHPITRGEGLDCDDYARQYIKMALDDGFIVSFDTMHPNELLIHFGIVTDQWHALNSTFIGNILYYIDPQTGVIACFGDVD